MEPERDEAREELRERAAMCLMQWHVLESSAVACRQRARLEGNCRSSSLLQYWIYVMWLCWIEIEIKSGIKLATEPSREIVPLKSSRDCLSSGADNVCINFGLVAI